MKILVIGGGRLGEGIAGLLSEERHDIVLIEKNENKSESLAETIDGLVICGDAMKKSVLRDADAANCDSVVVTTGDDSTNLKICRQLKSMNVTKVLARVTNPANEHHFAKEGVARTVNTTGLSVLAFRNLLEKPGKRVVDLVAGGKGRIFEIAIGKSSGMAGKKLKDVEKNFRISLILRKFCI